MRRSVIGFALVLVLAGCGGDPKAEPSPTPSTPVTSPVSSTPTPPAMPDAAKANTKAGAIAFVRHYIELINYLQATGEDAPLAEASRPSCKSCGAVIRAAKSIYDAGGHIEGGTWTISGAAASQPTSGLWSVRVTGRIAPSKVVGTGSATPKTGSGGPGDAEFFLTFTSQWGVSQWHTG